MEVIKGRPEYKIHTGDVTIQLKNVKNVLGITIEVPEDSTSDVWLQYDRGALVTIKAGGPARTIGGFYGSVPVVYDGEIIIRFVTPGVGNKCITCITSLQC